MNRNDAMDVSPHGWWESSTPECWKVSIQAKFFKGPFCVDFEHQKLRSQSVSFQRPFKHYYEAMRWAEKNLALVDQMLGNKPKESTE